jgi:hypothetical protein
MDRLNPEIYRPRAAIFAAAVLLLLSSSACVLTFFRTEPAGEDEYAAGRADPELVAEFAAQATQLSALATQVGKLDSDLQAQATIVHYLATRGPAQPASPSTPNSPTPYLPLRGGLEIEGGACCVGGIAGETTTIRVSFFAESPYGEVTGIRIFAGAVPRPPQDFEQVPWQAFLASTSYEIPIFINWTGFYVQVQFRDALGNLSPIYVDDISVEGMPAPFTPTP